MAQLEQENRRLKQMVAELSLHKEVLKAVIERKRLTPLARRAAIRQVMEQFSISQRRACRLLPIERSDARYQARGQHHDPALRSALEELAQRYPRYGYRRLRVQLHDAYVVNHTRVNRLYRQTRLTLRRKRGRRLTHRGVALVPHAP